ncbi:hypothetical protein [Vibrio alfacsensis]|uniref:hypothetical protein n=1 Tax=Vibrio alfacsensis TaxID=1074311 RepID=UPI004069628D
MTPHDALMSYKQDISERNERISMCRKLKEAERDGNLDKQLRRAIFEQGGHLHLLEDNIMKLENLNPDQEIEWSYKKIIELKDTVHSIEKGIEVKAASRLAGLLGLFVGVILSIFFAALGLLPKL